MQNPATQSSIPQFQIIDSDSIGLQWGEAFFILNANGNIRIGNKQSQITLTHSGEIHQSAKQNLTLTSKNKHIIINTPDPDHRR